MYKLFLVNFLTLFLNVYLLLIFARVILSFLPAAIGKFRLFIYNATEPILAPVRKIIPPIGGVIDLSPIIIYLVVEVVIELVIRYL